MTVRFKEKTEPLMLTQNKEYEVLEISSGLDWYRVIDDTDEDYLYPPECFEIEDDSPIPPDALEKALAGIARRNEEQ